MIPFEVFNQRVQGLMEAIAETCRKHGRDASTVQLLPVTKPRPAEAADYAARAGLSAVGENRVQEALTKKPLATQAVRWELIGHLQSNKAKLAVQVFDRVQSVDSEKLLNVLDRAAGESGRVLPVLLQINAGNDPNKFGADPADAPKLLELALGKSNLQVDGFMTIAPLSDDPAVAQRTFANLRQLRDDLGARFKVGLQVLSMGMSNDFAHAIEAGSTMVRVGTALYGEREP